MFSRKIAVWIGNLSFSIYLWHWPVLVAFRYITEDYSLSATHLIVALIITISLSYLAYKLIEAPFRRVQLRHEFIKRSAVLLSSVVVCLTLAALINPSIFAPLAPELTRYAEKDAICHGVILDDCLRGEDGASVKILLIGDSHAAHLNDFAEILGAELGIVFEVISASSCVPIANFDVEHLRENARPDCAAQIVHASTKIDDADAVLLAGKWVYHMPRDAFKEALIAFFDEMHSKSKPLAVLAQVPMLKGNFQRAYRLSTLGFPAVFAKNEHWQESNLQVREIAQKFSNTTFIDLSDLALFENAPIYQESPIYMDSHHLNEIGSQIYGASAAIEFSKWLRSHNFFR
jgi:hypothetical protein